MSLKPAGRPARPPIGRCRTLAPDRDPAALDPLDRDRFARAMAGLGPFEPRPAVAVAVSGGADSLALTLLAADWIEAEGGTLIALTVDHRLRADSGAEAVQVGRWLASRGITHRILPWTGAKPASGVQAAARNARYDLLGRYCREHGILHVLLGHHRRDQAETVLLRRAAGSGPIGLAGMAGVVEAPSCRFLRPLLDVPPEQLRAFLRMHGQPWLDDPANRDPRFARTALRDPTRPGRPVAEAAVLRYAARQKRRREALERAASQLVATAVAVHPAGFAWVDPAALAGSDPCVAATALGSIVACIGGGRHAPAASKLQRLLAAVTAEPLRLSRTLGCCRLATMHGSILVYRESRNVPAPVPVPAEGAIRWDNRFHIVLSGAFRPENPDPPRLGALGIDAARALAAHIGPAAPHRPDGIPPAVWPTLPALFDADGLIAVPHLGFRRDGVGPGSARINRIAFRPYTPAGGVGGFLAYGHSPIMS
ncbi:MAG: tRNA lysidine(34) synthetase TilS [Rhodospirillales bacterium]|nr:MAG: tRNA lysidine(34) synthetase TilS [Rhodospirillales bacterium]